MAKHDVTFTLPERALGRANVEFKVKRDGKPFGRLKVSNGTIVWVSARATYGRKMRWVDFDALMRKHGKDEKK